MSNLFYAQHLCVEIKSQSFVKYDKLLLSIYLSKSLYCLDICKLKKITFFFTLHDVNEVFFQKLNSAVSNFPKVRDEYTSV